MARVEDMATVHSGDMVIRPKGGWVKVRIYSSRITIPGPSDIARNFCNSGQIYAPGL